MPVRLSLRLRLTAWATLAALILFGAGALLLYQDLTGQLSAAISTQLSVRLHDLESVPRAEELSHQHRVALTQLVTTGGRVIEPAGEDRVLTRAELAAAGQHRITVDRQIPQVDDEARLMARRVRIPGQRTSVIGVAAASTKPLEQARSRLLLLLGLGGPILAALVGAAAWFVTGAALRPVRRMAREASAISSMRSGERLAEPVGHDEIADLGRTLNAMLDRVGDAVAHERSFVDDAAHELRTPLAVLRGELELAIGSLDELGDDADVESVRASLTSAVEEADRLTQLSTDLLTLARSDAGQLHPMATPVDLPAVARRVAGGLGTERVGVEVIGAPVATMTDERWLVEILTNLVGNAVRAASAQVRVQIAEVGDRVQVVVSDDGAGFAPEVLEHAFDRFVRGTDARRRGDGGAGLGLAITRSLVLASDGSIEAGNAGALGGAWVRVTLPLARQEPDRA